LKKNNYAFDFFILCLLFAFVTWIELVMCSRMGRGMMNDGTGSAFDISFVRFSFIISIVFAIFLATSQEFKSFNYLENIPRKVSFYSLCLFLFILYPLTSIGILSDNRGLWGLFAGLAFLPLFVGAIGVCVISFLISLFWKPDWKGAKYNTKSRRRDNESPNVLRIVGMALLVILIFHLNNSYELYQTQKRIEASKPKPPSIPVECQGVIKDASCDYSKYTKSSVKEKPEDDAATPYWNEHFGPNGPTPPPQAPSKGAIEIEYDKLSNISLKDTCYTLSNGVKVACKNIQGDHLDQVSAEKMCQAFSMRLPTTNELEEMYNYQNQISNLTIIADSDGWPYWSNSPDYRYANRITFTDGAFGKPGEVNNIQTGDAFKGYARCVKD